MQTLSNGVKKPADGDRGGVFWDALETNAQLQNDHKHDGSDGEPIDSFDLARGTAAVTSSSWNASGDMYRKTITMPTGFTWGACVILAFLNSDGSQIFPKMEKINSTSFYLYMPTSNLAVDLLYT